jgi:hypothetical protein
MTVSYESSMVNGIQYLSWVELLNTPPILTNSILFFFFFSFSRVYFINIESLAYYM